MMKNPAFLSSHPTGFPAGMAPMIVDQSPELATRNVFDNHSYSDELDLRNELMPKSTASMTGYGITDMPLRARDSTHELGTLHYNQTSFDGNSLSASTFDSGRSASQGTYADGVASSRPSTSDDGDYSPLPFGYQPKIANCGPREGPVGTSIQVTMLTCFKIDARRSVAASCGTHQAVATVTPLGDSAPPYRYLVSFQATVQTTSQWPKSKTCVPISLYIPFEGFDNEVTIDLGMFTYTDNGAPAARSNSGLGRKRRPSSTGYDPRSPELSTTQDTDYSGVRPSKSRYGQLPPIRSDHNGGISSNNSGTNKSSSTLHVSAPYPTSSLQDEYQNHQSESLSHFYPSMLSNYSYPSTCAPSTPSWTGSTSSASLSLAGSVGTMQLTGDNIALRGSNPRFVRRRNDQIASISAPGVKPQPTSFNPYSMYPNNKAALRLEGDLSTMTQDWTAREKQDKRRLVHFSRVQSGSTIHANFRPIDPDQKEPNLTLISCIWREDRNECYVTSVDTISLLEALVTPDTAFTVEEKNRIRRNLEGFHPETISKQKVQNEDFFKQIMGYPPPRPRHIEKDVKVFKWSILEVALKKIISKYCASYASTSDVPRRQVTDTHYVDGNTTLQSQDLVSTDRGSLPTTTQYAMVPSNSHPQQVPLSASSTGSFSDYAPSYPQYPSTMPARYPQYTTHHHLRGGLMGMTNCSPGQQQQHLHHQHQQQQSGRQTVGFGSDWSHSYV